MGMSNAQAADYLLDNLLCYHNYIPDFNTAILKGAAALALASEEEVNELCENLWNQLYNIYKRENFQEGHSV